jgi:hypothetical protein
MGEGLRRSVSFGQGRMQIMGGCGGESLGGGGKSNLDRGSLDGAMLDKQLKEIKARSPVKKEEEEERLEYDSPNSMESTKKPKLGSPNGSGKSVNDLGSGKSIKDLGSPHSLSNLEIVGSRYMSANVIEEGESDMSLSDGGSDSIPEVKTFGEKMGAFEERQILGQGSGGIFKEGSPS